MVEMLLGTSVSHIMLPGWNPCSSDSSPASCQCTFWKAAGYGSTALVFALHVGTRDGILTSAFILTLDFIKQALTFAGIWG